MIGCFQIKVFSVKGYGEKSHENSSLCTIIMTLHEQMISISIWPFIYKEAILYCLSDKDHC